MFLFCHCHAHYRLQESNANVLETLALEMISPQYDFWYRVPKNTHISTNHQELISPGSKKTGQRKIFLGLLFQPQSQKSESLEFLP